MASIKKEKYRVGIDIGGTFTDVVLMGEEEGAHRLLQGGHDACESGGLFR